MGIVVTLPLDLRQGNLVKAKLGLAGDAKEPRDNPKQLATTEGCAAILGFVPLFAGLNFTTKFGSCYRHAKPFVNGRSQQLIQLDELEEMGLLTVWQKGNRLGKIRQLSARLGDNFDPTRSRIGIQRNTRRYLVFNLAKECAQLTCLSGQWRQVKFVWLPELHGLCVCQSNVIVVTIRAVGERWRLWRASRRSGSQRSGAVARRTPSALLARTRLTGRRWRRV